MRLHRVEWINAKSDEKNVYTFETASSGKKPLSTKGNRIQKLLEYCFGDDEKTMWDVTVFFGVNGEEYSYRKKNTEEGGLKISLKQQIEGKFKTVARQNNARVEAEKALQQQIADVLRLDYVSCDEVKNFHGNLDAFYEFQLLLDVWNNVKKSTEATRQKSEAAYANIKALSKDKIVEVSPDEIETISQQINDSRQAIFTMQNRLSKMKQDNAVAPIANEIITELSAAQTRYQQLQSQRDAMEAGRERLKNRDAIASVVPSIRTLEKLSAQKNEYDQTRHSVVTELEWTENELASVNSQIAAKQKQTGEIYEKRSKSEVINAELNNVAELYDRNKTLNEYLVQLQEQSERLLAEKTLLKNKMVNVKNAITEIKQRIDEFKLPNKSIGELLETVRVDVKIDEVNSQIDKLQSEVAVKESQIAERESNLVLQVRKFKSVAELDVSIAPVKAKDTILQVLDGKMTKLEMVNDSLKEKQKNFQRAYEDYNYKLIQLEQSKAQLEGQLEKTRFKKQEEFKREVYLNSQKVYSDDMTGVFAVTTNLDDDDIVALKKQIADRNADKDVIVSKASALQGRMDELKRETEINEAEIATLRREKLNIINRYNEIISQNRNETVFNYLKALESNNGTKYLLDVQQDAVRNEAELSELKKNVATLKGKLTSLQGRQRYLKETQKSLDNTEASLDHLIETNDQVKEQLSDIGGRLSSNYELYRAIGGQLDDLDEKLGRVNEMLVETSKTIKVNEKQIAASQEKAGAFADGKDIAQVLETSKVEAADIESERLMLLETKSKLDKDVFKKRLELEKSQWLFDKTSTDYDELKEKVQFELNLKGISVEQVQSVNFEEDSEQLRKELAAYDAEKNALAEKIENFYVVLKNQPQGIPAMEKGLPEKIADLQSKIDLLEQAVEQLEKARQEKMSLYLSANSQKMKVAVATAEAQTIADLQHTLSQNNVVDALLEDKFKDALRIAEKYARVLCQKDYVFANVGGTMTISVDGDTVDFDALDDTEKTLIYIAVLLAVPQSRASDGRWLLVDDKLKVDGKAMQAALAKIDNIDFCVEYNSFKLS